MCGNSTFFEYVYSVSPLYGHSFTQQLFISSLVGKQLMECHRINTVSMKAHLYLYIFLSWRRKALCLIHFFKVTWIVCIPKNYLIYLQTIISISRSSLQIFSSWKYQKGHIDLGISTTEYSRKLFFHSWVSAVIFILCVMYKFAEISPVFQSLRTLSFRQVLCYHLIQIIIVFFSQVFVATSRKCTVLLTWTTK